MYTKLEIVTLFIHCANVAEVMEATKALRYVMDDIKNFEVAEFVRRNANNRIRILTLKPNP